MAAEAAHEAGMARRDLLEHVADVDAVDRARRAAQRIALIAGEGDHRAVHPLLHPPSDQANDALVPGLVEQTKPQEIAALRLEAHPREQLECLALHLELDLASCLVELGELAGELP